MVGSGRKHHCRCFANSTPLIGSKRTTNRRANDAKMPATFMFSPAGNVYVPAKTHPSSNSVHCRLLSPGRDKPPAHFRQQPCVIGNVDDIDLLRRGDVVAWLKVLSRTDQQPSAEQQRSGLEAGKSAASNVGNRSKAIPRSGATHLCRCARGFNVAQKRNRSRKLGQFYDRVHRYVA